MGNICGDAGQDIMSFSGNSNIYATGARKLKGKNKEEMNEAAKTMAEAYFIKLDTKKAGKLTQEEAQKLIQDICAYLEPNAKKATKQAAE